MSILLIHPADVRAQPNVRVPMWQSYVTTEPAPFHYFEEKPPPHSRPLYHSVPLPPILHSSLQYNAMRGWFAFGQNQGFLSESATTEGLGRLRIGMPGGNVVWVTARTHRFVTVGEVLEVVGEITRLEYWRQQNKRAGFRYVDGVWMWCFE